MLEHFPDVARAHDYRDVAILQLALVLTSRTNTAIHDLMAATVVVDIQSQMIFDSAEELVAYKNKLHAETAARDSYIP